MPAANLDLFTELPSPASAPAGFRYSAGFLGFAEEAALVAELRRLDLAPYEFRGVQARRRVRSFGFSHGYQKRRLERSEVIPPFLTALRSAVAGFVGLPSGAFAQVLVSEYTPGTPIGWHKDREHYEIIAGLSLLSSATLRFRRATDQGWQRQAQIVEPRSIYLLTGAARDQWQHSIPAVPALRYSITFRTMRRIVGADDIAAIDS